MEEFKYGELYKDENGDVFVVAHDPCVLTNFSSRQIIKINRFIQEYKNELKEYLDSFIDINDELTIAWIDNSNKKRTSEYKIITPISYI